MAGIGKVLAIALIAGSCTGIGALPIFLAHRITHRIYDGMVALAAGVMIGASMFTLVIPALNYGTLLEVSVGLAAGAGFLLLLDRQLDFHIDFDEELADYKKRAMLIGGSITLHNIPEGLAIGIAFGSGLEGVGLALGLAIGVQNIPDGFAVAVPADRAGLPKLKNLALTTLSGAVPEPIAAVFGFALVQIFTQIFPLAAGFAASAMMAVVFKEMIPQSHGHGYQTLATAMFILGFIIMLVIDNTFTV
ncbi:MAG: ZIP family metal transporter [Candidatus Nanohaloarchaea archaeon]|nr:ZIP family metal transporter [Candidatus Nanohaloarchaea archaeon]